MNNLLHGKKYKKRYVKKAKDDDSLMTEFLTSLLETMLEEELTVFIGRDRYKRRNEKEIRIYRNVYRVRNYLTIMSKMLKLRVPRCRSGGSIPNIAI